MAVNRIWFPNAPDSSIDAADRAQIGIGYGGIVIGDVVIPVGSGGGETASGMRSIGAEIRNKIGEAINPSTEETLLSIISELQSLTLASGDNLIGRVKITDGNDIVNVFTDGENASSGTGIGIFGIDASGKARFMRVNDNGILQSNQVDLVMGKVLKELKKMNLQLSMMTNVWLENEDIGDC